MDGEDAARKSSAWAAQPYMASARHVENSVGCRGSLKVSRWDPPLGLRGSLDRDRKWVGESPRIELHPHTKVSTQSHGDSEIYKPLSTSMRAPGDQG